MSEADAPINAEIPPPATPAEVLGMTRAEWKSTAQAWGFAEVHASTLWYQLYQAGLREFQTSDRLPPRFVERVLQEHRLHFPPVIRETRSSDGFTRKYLLGLPDGEVIETVLMRYSGRTTACVSSQVGCAMGCVFCATGQRGYTRHLTAGEIVGQLLHVDRVLRETAHRSDQPESTVPALANPRHASVFHRHERLRNVVFMGMGEPLANYKSLMGAIHRMVDPVPEGLGMSARGITVSTVGLVPRMRELATEGLPLRLAVSLHAPDDELRDTLVPINTRYPVSEVLDAAWHYADVTGRRVSIEYALIRGVNDQRWRAELLAKRLRGHRVHVNLIPLNPTPGSEWTASDPDDELAFVRALEVAGVPVTVRDTRGREIDGACGQLAAATP